MDCFFYLSHILKIQYEKDIKRQEETGDEIKLKRQTNLSVIVTLDLERRWNRLSSKFDVSQTE